MSKEHDILIPFLDYMFKLTPTERIWLIDQFNKYFCDKCGEDFAECCKIYQARSLLRGIKEEYRFFSRFADVKNIPYNSGKTMSFRKYE